MNRNRQKRLIVRHRVHEIRDRFRFTTRLSRCKVLVFIVSVIGILVAMFVHMQNGESRRERTMINTSWNPDNAPPEPAAMLLTPEVVGAPGSSQLRIPLTEFLAHEMRFFAYHSPSQSSVRFIVARQGHDDLFVALDRCRRCRTDGTGFFQEADRIVCRTCGYSAVIKELSSNDHECRPVSIAAVIDGRTLTIQTAALEAVYGVFNEE